MTALSYLALTFYLVFFINLVFVNLPLHLVAVMYRCAGFGRGYRFNRASEDLLGDIQVWFFTEQSHFVKLKKNKVSCITAILKYFVILDFVAYQH